MKFLTAMILVALPSFAQQYGYGNTQQYGYQNGIPYNAQNTIIYNAMQDQQVRNVFRSNELATVPAPQPMRQTQCQQIGNGYNCLSN